MMSRGSQQQHREKNMCAALTLQVNSIQSPVVQQADVPKPVIEFPEFLHELHAMFKMIGIKKT